MILTVLNPVTNHLAQSLDQVPASMDFDDPSTHEALGEGDVTRRLLAMLVEDDPESRELCGITLDRRGPRHAGPHKHPGTVAEARSIDRGVSRVLQELGLVEPATVAKAEDEVYQELARLQQELRIKTAECRSRMHDVRVSTARPPCLDRCNFFMRALSLSSPSPPTSANPILLVNLTLLPLCS